MDFVFRLLLTSALGAVAFGQWEFLEDVVAPLVGEIEEVFDKLTNETTSTDLPDTSNSTESTQKIDIQNISKDTEKPSTWKTGSELTTILTTKDNVSATPIDFQSTSNFSLSSKSLDTSEIEHVTPSSASYTANSSIVITKITIDTTTEQVSPNSPPLVNISSSIPTSSPTVTETRTSTKPSSHLPFSITTSGTPITKSQPTVWSKPVNYGTVSAIGQDATTTTTPKISDGTVKMAVLITFLVIAALGASAFLVFYFGLKKKTQHYDEILLLS